MQTVPPSPLVFIDIKTHSDFVLPINPKAESKVRQGVTTGDHRLLWVSQSRQCCPERRRSLPINFSVAGCHPKS